jgi:putative SOS response-associated peptidase YedK
MCGRFVATAPPSELADYFQAVLNEAVVDDEAEPNYNVAPTNAVHVVRAREGHREIDLMRWGLVPSWAKDTKIGSKLINARAETAAAKPAFRSAMKRRRCLVPATGFYEWAKVEGQKTKQPYYITRADDEPVVFAGLWAAWKSKEHDDSGGGDEDWLITCTLITTTPNHEMKEIHDRMPVLIPPSDWDRWLDPANSVDQVGDILTSAPDGLLRLTPITTRVNNVRNKGPELLEPAPVG